MPKSHELAQILILWAVDGCPILSQCTSMPLGILTVDRKKKKGLLI